jgi:hypothetical protein
MRSVQHGQELHRLDYLSEGGRNVLKCNRSMISSHTDSCGAAEIYESCVTQDKQHGGLNSTSMPSSYNREVAIQIETRPYSSITPLSPKEKKSQGI